MSHETSHERAERPAAGLDEKALMALRALDPQGGDGIMLRVLGAFERSLANMLGQLRDEATMNNSEALFRVAHTLKAPAASCGAPALSELAREVEQRHRAGASPAPIEAGELRADVTRLVREGEAVLMAVRAMLRL